MPRRRKLLLVALLFAVAFAAFALLRKKPPPNEVSSQPDSLAVAPAPPPKALPLLGVAGESPLGAPLQTIDQAGFRSLLLHKRYAELDRYFEQLQSDFEKDFRKEDWVLDAADSFYSYDPELQIPLDAWVKASDRSFASVLARGTWSISMAWAARGEGWAKDVTPEAWEKTRLWLARGSADLDRAIALRPTLGAARRGLINAASVGGDDETREKAYARAIDECPACYQVRVTEIFTLRPNWGGSLEKMEALAKAAPVEKNPRLKLLHGFAPLEEAAQLVRADKLPEARVKIEEALRFGDSPAFYEQRAKISMREDRDDDALHDFDRALELRPTLTKVRVQRAYLQIKRKAYEEAGVDLLGALRVQPNNPEAVRLWPSVVQGLTYTLDLLYKANNVADAERVSALAMELAADQKLVRQWNNWVTKLALGDAGVEELQAKADAAPNDFRAHRLLDQRFYSQGQHEATIAMWNRFLAANPDHGGALLERSGANWQAGHPTEAIADATAACELGTNAGCSVATELKRRVGAK